MTTVQVVLLQAPMRISPSTLVDLLAGISLEGIPPLPNTRDMSVSGVVSALSDVLQVGVRYLVTSVDVSEVDCCVMT